MKKIVSLLLLLSLVLGLTACGDKTPALDAEEFVFTVLESDAFSASLYELPESKASSFYGVDESKLQKAYLYHATGVSKEQIVVLHAADSNAAAEMVSALKALLQEWIEADRDYAPAEVPKMEKAILRQQGEWVVLVIAGDPAVAEKAVDKFF